MRIKLQITWKQKLMFKLWIIFINVLDTNRIHSTKIILPNNIFNIFQYNSIYSNISVKKCYLLSDLMVM